MISRIMKILYLFYFWYGPAFVSRENSRQSKTFSRQYTGLIKIFSKFF